MGPDDTSNKTIQAVSYQPLPFSEEQLAALTLRHSHETIHHVPGLAFWAMTEEHRKMNNNKNVTGHQQRAWDFYWSIRAAMETGYCVLGIGCGGVGGPFQITSDAYNGTPPESKSNRYGDTYSYSNMRVDANTPPWPFNDNQLGGVIFNHSFEHLADQMGALHEALRITRPGGYVCILMPDITYSRRGSIDDTHTVEWCADAFLDCVQAYVLRWNSKATIVAHNTLDNAFSFDTVIQKG